LPQKRLESAETLILTGVDEFMKHQSPVSPTIRPDEYAVSQGQSSRVRGDELGCRSGSAKKGMVWKRNLTDLEEPNFVGMNNADRGGGADLSGGERYAAPKDDALLFFRPCASQREQLCKLFWIDHLFDYDHQTLCLQLPWCGIPVGNGDRSCRRG